MTIAIAYCHGGTVRHEWELGLRALLDRPDVAAEIAARGPYIPENRNLLARQFLATDAEWMFSIDVDIVLQPDTLDLLLAAAHPTGKPVVGALYFVQYDSTPAGSWWPTWLEERAGSQVTIVSNVRLGELRPLTATGMGATLIHRSVFERLAEATDDPWPFYGNDIINGKRAGEDVTFCHRARAAGFTVWGLAHVVGHMKQVAIGWAQFVSQFPKEENHAVPQGLLSRSGIPLSGHPGAAAGGGRPAPQRLRPRR